MFFLFSGYILPDLEDSVVYGDSWRYSGKLLVLILSMPGLNMVNSSLGVFFQFWYNICLVVLWVSQGTSCRLVVFFFMWWELEVPLGTGSFLFYCVVENWRCHLAPVRFLFIVLWRTGGAPWHRFVFFFLWLLLWCRKVPGFCPVLAVVLSILFLDFYFYFCCCFFIFVSLCVSFIIFLFILVCGRILWVYSLQTLTRQHSSSWGNLGV